MNGTDKKYLIDTNIIIYHLNGENIATEFLINNIDHCAISRITYIEVLSFNFSNEEEKLVKQFLNLFFIIDTNEKIANQSILNKKNKKIKLPDNIIAATAQIYNLILLTRNVKDFKNLKLKILNLFEKDSL